ncbi:hypothetical protein M0802_006492 [Mischocyttarus mexicanus]|nr:hypothetical protein M0802_006492 [Mischocyttarus mexicanus]
MSAALCFRNLDSHISASERTSKQARKQVSSSNSSSRRLKRLHVVLNSAISCKLGRQPFAEGCGRVRDR